MFDKLKNLFSKESALYKKEKDYSMNPDRDWKIILVVFFIINIVLSSFLFITFRDLSNESAFDIVATSTPSQIFDEKALEKVLEIYSSKEERMNILLKGAPTSTDPSI